MDERDLTRRLEDLAPPDVDEARERAKLAARVRLSQAPLGRQHARREPGWRVFLPRFGRSRRATMMLLLALALGALALSATGPGQALAEWVGQQIGLGRPGGAPSLHRLRTQVDVETVARGAPAYVLARGPFPGHGHYEFLGYRSIRNGEPCFELDLPGLPSAAGSGCRTALGARHALRVDAAGSSFPRLGVQVAGRASSDAHSVQVALGDRTVEAELQPVSRAARQKINLRRPFGVFVAFLGADAFRRGEQLTVTSFDARGEPLARRSLLLPRIGADYDRRCERLLLEGHSRRALESCG